MEGTVGATEAFRVETRRISYLFESAGTYAGVIALACDVSQDLWAQKTVSTHGFDCCREYPFNLLIRTYGHPICPRCIVVLNGSLHI